VLGPLSRVWHYPERIDLSCEEMGESFVSVVIIPPAISSMKPLISSITCSGNTRPRARE
jgi:hypothetical protein